MVPGRERGPLGRALLVAVTPRVGDEPAVVGERLAGHVHQGEGAVGVGLYVEQPLDQQRAGLVGLVAPALLDHDHLLAVDIDGVDLVVRRGAHALRVLLPAADEDGEGESERQHAVHWGLLFK